MHSGKKSWLITFAGIFLFLYGCTGLVVGGAAVVAGSGTYLYVKGELKTDYYYPFDSVWSACEKTIADMRGIDIVPKKEIGVGTIECVIDDEKVKFTVTYKAKNITSVAIRVGFLGDRLSSQRLHDKISDNLMKK